MLKILIIEDDPAIREGLSVSLQQEHYSVLCASDGQEGYRLAREERLDVIILDLMLPGKNGESICRDLRAEGINTPILMLTSKGEEVDKVMGLEAGADDYITKPFGVRELLARIKAILRRQGTQKSSNHETYSFGNIIVDLKKQEVSRAVSKIKLSVREFEVLKFFIRHEGEIVTRDMLLNEVWGYDAFPTTRTVDNYILNLRKKLERNPSEPRHLLTIHTAGYKFVKNPVSQ